MQPEWRGCLAPLFRIRFEDQHPNALTQVCKGVGVGLLTIKELYDSLVTKKTYNRFCCREGTQVAHGDCVMPKNEVGVTSSYYYNHQRWETPRS